LIHLICGSTGAGKTAYALRLSDHLVPCVLDLGFSQTQSRAKFADLAKAASLSVQLHFIDVPAEERWRRVETRNTQKGRLTNSGSMSRVRCSIL